MTNQQAKKLLKKYHDGTATGEERDLVESWFLKLKAEQQPHDLPDGIIENDTDEVWLALRESHLPAKSIRLWPRIAAAASILVFLSVGSYFLFHKQPNKQIAQNKIHDIAPGGNKAILTLASGKKIILTNSANGLLAKQQNVAIQKVADGQIDYKASENESAAMVYDTLTIPKKGQFILKLSDGTKVWLNAATIIRYPEKFIGTERRVELISGEAYFAVVHNAKMPFMVSVNHQTIEDIGTEFNVNAYSDEASVTTTLIQGSIRLTSLNISKVIKPGQQASLNDGIINMSTADIDEVVGWKNGDFVFDGTDMKQVMRQLSRWYDAKIEYQGNVSNIGFVSTISRSKNLSEVLNILQRTGGVHFKIGEGRIIVMP